MILRSLHAPSDAQQLSGPRKASDVFIETQKKVEPPYAIIFQARHSALAGKLAQRLLPAVFGELPPEVIRAIREHDFGWQNSDEAQVASVAQRQPRPFPALSAQETMPSWWNSVAHAKSLGPLEYVMISRHFCLLGAGDAGRADFVRAENENRPPIEQTLPYSASDLDRWTGAMGFCDLLSLYLCSGSDAPVQFPIAHPAHPAASNAQKVTLHWEKNAPAFSRDILQPGAAVSLNADQYSGEGTDLSPMRIEWRFANSAHDM